MRYLLDTNILLHLLRETPLAAQIESDFDLWNPENRLLLSVASEGEIRSLAIQFGWGEKRLRKVDAGLKDFAIIPIQTRDIIDRYAEIDAFSQDKLPEKPLGNSARNMGKNDLWIAATASVLEAKLLTTDADFDHLAGVFLDLERVVF